VSPLPLGLLCAALLAGSVALSNPLAIAACAAVAAALLWASPPPRGAYIWFAASSAVLVFVANPFVSVQGLTPIWSGPHIPVLDTEVTQEELVFGLAAGLRLIGSSCAIAAFVRLADGDQVLAALARVAPRSAMIAALAGRLLPTLERDAGGLAMAARARAARLDRRVPAAALAAPLVGLSLERSLALAEAMEARGYGGGPRTRTPRPAVSGAERWLLAVAIVTAAVIAAAVPLDRYRYYDLLGDPLTAVGLGTAGAVLLLGGAALVAIRAARSVR
jgi:energy-coupling factor transport system permease protein